MNISMVLLVVSAVWITSELMLLLFRGSNARSKSHDSGSMVWLNAVIYGTIAIAVNFEFSGIGIIPGAGFTLACIGLVLIILGLGIRWAHAILYLDTRR